MRLETAGGLTMRPADVRAGLHVPMLRHYAAIEGARILLTAATFELLPSQSSFEQPNGGMLQIAAGVTLVGQEGVVLTGHNRQLVQSEGVRFESLHLPQGVVIRKGGSLTMVKCTSTGAGQGFTIGVYTRDLGHGGLPRLRRRGHRRVLQR